MLQNDWNYRLRLDTGRMHPTGTLRRPLPHKNPLVFEYVANFLVKVFDAFVFIFKFEFLLIVETCFEN